MPSSVSRRPRSGKTLSFAVIARDTDVRDGSIAGGDGSIAGGDGSISGGDGSIDYSGQVAV
ncbi:MAG: hypothetical protein ABEJ28_11680, partial [Salinigranum sp.]